MICVFIRRDTDTDTGERQPHKDRGKGWNYAATDQERPEAARS